MAVPFGRIKRRQDFLRIAAARRKWAAPGLVLQTAEISPRDGAAEDVAPRIGFTCSKKVGNAVERNRARRRLRALAAEILPRFAAVGRDYVLIGRAATVRRPYALLLQDLKTALKRVGAFRDGADEPSSGRE